MHSTNVRQIKAALVEQAFLGSTRVSCPIGPIVAVRRRKGQLLVMIRGWGRWYPVESVSIERIGPQLLQEFWLGPLMNIYNQDRYSSVILGAAKNLRAEFDRKNSSGSTYVQAFPQSCRIVEDVFQ
jgi:hypothetical protein